ncbi:MAG: substrate-binding domain-containing protein [Rhodopseudomonas palustris]|nr:substrate-binding domain-containing protein [Rhodopseudomonas palustris]
MAVAGAGATSARSIYSKWADAYKKETGSGLNYQSIGSGGGIKQITAQDRRLRRHRRAAARPSSSRRTAWCSSRTVIGAIVPVVNLDRHQAAAS